MALKKSGSSALRPDPNLSLFKFKLSWKDEPSPMEIKTQTWYSYDYSYERESFPCGLDKDLRMHFKQLLGLCSRHDGLYEFTKWLRPHVNCGRLDLYLPNWPEIFERIPVLESRYGWHMLEAYCQDCGFTGLSFQTVKRSHPRQPGHSPGRTDFSKFYGFGYFQRNNFIANNLACGKLLKVDVYDNLMYHSENFLCTHWGAAKHSHELGP